MTIEEAAKGPNGRNLCRWCRTEVAGRRRTFCSDFCVHQWRLRSSVTYLRQCVWERDRGICALCGFDAARERLRVMRLRFAQRMQELKRLQGMGVAPKGRKSWWDADHIVPVVEGGDSNLENVRTLCRLCHREVTAVLRARLRIRRSATGRASPQKDQSPSEPL